MSLSGESAFDNYMNTCGAECKVSLLLLSNSGDMRKHARLHAKITQADVKKSKKVLTLKPQIIPFSRLMIYHPSIALNCTINLSL